MVCVASYVTVTSISNDVVLSFFTSNATVGDPSSIRVSLEFKISLQLLPDRFVYNGSLNLIPIAIFFTSVVVPELTVLSVSPFIVPVFATSTKPTKSALASVIFAFALRDIITDGFSIRITSALLKTKSKLLM